MTGLPPAILLTSSLPKKHRSDFVGTVLFLRPPGRTSSPRCRKNKTRSFRCGLLVGRDDRIRTCDSCVPNAVRYRAALHPDSGIPTGRSKIDPKEKAHWPSHSPLKAHHPASRKQNLAAGGKNNILPPSYKIEFGSVAPKAAICRKAAPSWSVRSEGNILSGDQTAAARSPASP
jgi:hypothetical protein